MEWLRALLFYLGLALSIIIIVPLLVLLFPLPFHLRYFTVTRWTLFNLWWLRVTCNLRHEVSGREHIPSGPAIVMSNHQSAWETLVLQIVFPAQVWILKRELLWIPIYGWGLATMQPIAINRGSIHKSFSQIVDQGSQRLAAGLWVVIFPEGTRVPAGETRRYGLSGTLLAQAAGRPIVPVAHNAGFYWPRRSLLKRKGTIDVVVGAPIDTAGREPRELTAEIQSWIEGEIAGMEKPAA